jgi:hypothetical protein
MTTSTLLAALLLFVTPFWEAKAPAQWTDIELRQLLADSPWAQLVPGPTKAFAPIQIYIATAGPVRQAQQEIARRGNKPGATEYSLWFEDFSATQIIVAVRVDKLEAYSEGKEVQLLQKDSVMRAGRRKIKMTGYFPPSGSDPYVRMAFPRGGVQLSDKTVGFDLYIPGVPGGFRSVEFKLQDMQVGGKLEL